MMFITQEKVLEAGLVTSSVERKTTHTPLVTMGPLPEMGLWQD